MVNFLRRIWVVFSYHQDKVDWLVFMGFGTQINFQVTNQEGSIIFIERDKLYFYFTQKNLY